jgi:hypothetical protein
VEASSPDGRPVTLSAAPLPAGATFTAQPADPQAPGVARAVFDWRPPTGTIGNYLVVYTARDGNLGATRSASINEGRKAGKAGSSLPFPVRMLCAHCNQVTRNGRLFNNEQFA